jgi:hypothetical protein
MFRAISNNFTRAFKSTRGISSGHISPQTSYTNFSSGGQNQSDNDSGQQNSANPTNSMSYCYIAVAALALGSKFDNLVDFAWFGSTTKRNKVEDRTATLQ